MGRALRLAESGLGRVWPNPTVGTVIVGGGALIAEARTQQHGRPHAEVVALQIAGPAARGATMYVTLEPCSHWGRTPPCCDAIVRAGIGRIVVAVRDPDPRVDGRGIARLRGEGIDVEVGLEEAEAARINAGFFCRIRQGRPRVEVVAPSEGDVPPGFDARLTLVDGGWLAQVVVDPQPLDVRTWRVVADGPGARVVAGGGASPEPPAPRPEAALACLGQEGLTRVAVVRGGPAERVLRDAGLTDAG